jgi:hypothetical protein
MEADVYIQMGSSWQHATVEIDPVDYDARAYCEGYRLLLVWEKQYDRQYEIDRFWEC